MLWFWLVFWAEFSAFALSCLAVIACAIWMLYYFDVGEAWEDWWGPGVERNEDKGYVGVRELSWGGQQGMVGLYVICGCGEFFCTIARPPPSTTCDGYPIILQAWSEEVWKGETSYFYLLTIEWYLEICRGGQETLGTSGGVLLPKTKLDQSRPNLGIVSQWEPVMYLNRRAPGSQPIKEQRPQSKEACVVAGQLWILSDICDMASGNRLPRLGKRLPEMKGLEIPLLLTCSGYETHCVAP